MATIMAINAGSSSLKFQLLSMPEETIITKGLVERIGLKDSVFAIEKNGEKHETTSDIEDHSEAVKMLLDKLTSLNIISSLDEIEGIGHRVVHGGEKFNDSVLITDDLLAGIEEVSELAPLHNPANITGIKAFKEVYQTFHLLRYLILHSTKQCQSMRIYTACLMSIIPSTASVSMVSTGHHTSMCLSARRKCLISQLKT